MSDAVENKLYGCGLGQYLSQLLVVERQMRDERNRVVAEAEARGAKVFYLMDEIVIEEPDLQLDC